MPETTMTASPLAELALSPEGHIYFDTSAYATETLPSQLWEKLKSLFQDPMRGLLHLGIEEFSALPPSFLFWQSFSRQFLASTCKLIGQAEKQSLPDIPAPSEVERREIIQQGLSLRGFEYLNQEVLLANWQRLREHLGQELLTFPGTLQDFLNQYNPRWNLVGRVCFHLAENKSNPERPFAFLATYTTQLVQNQSLENSAAQHVPLKRALQDYAGEKNHAALLALLLPVQKAAKQSPFVQQLVDSGSVFQAAAWTASEAYGFLQAVPWMESSGIMVRIPNWWSPKKPPRPRITVKIGEQKGASLGLNTLLDFQMSVALNDHESLTQDELQALLEAEEGLVKIKGQWIEVSREKLAHVLAHWQKLQKKAEQGLSMLEALRLLSGGAANSFGANDLEEAAQMSEWSTVAAGSWLKDVLEQLKSPDGSAEKGVETIIKGHLRGELRPYQRSGVQWLWLLYQLRLGGCLADDMGLGKTVQVLCLLLIIKHHPQCPLHGSSVPPASIGFGKSSLPHLLIVPASLLGNWQAEAARFAPGLRTLVAHSSAAGREGLENMAVEQLAGVDMVITTYAFVLRLKWLLEVSWDLIILDEAQLIKNPASKQTKAVKALKSQVRLTLTGTPIENRLGDLWSLFDFTSPGLLGSSKAFSDYAKKAPKGALEPQPNRFMAILRKLTQPYILRRLKSDKKVISDLPDKTELQAYCPLSKEQIQLYQLAIKELIAQLEKAKADKASGIQHKGLVLSFLMRFKQICNHPDQWLGYGDYAPEKSGKFLRLREICEEIAAKQEKVLVFTQFKEIIPQIAHFLAKVFGREGLILHGDTPIHKRAELVASFQQELGPPFFVLSLKAGGTGLNLTRASHVIHFDRWWNPSVENQATDRAYRIGQKHPVLVHKFICQGTVEDKIDALIASKKQLSQEILAEGNEMSLTEMSDEQLLQIVSLDMQHAIEQ